MEKRTHKQWAMALIAAYERPGADAYEEHVASLAARWLRMISSPYTTKKMVDTFLGDLDAPAAANYGCGWDDLRKRFLAWAKETGWTDGTRVPRSCGYENL
jgi:hypothetical protein